MRQGFTLIELLVVISIIALLIAILLPALSAARENGVRTQCLGKATQIATATFAYAADTDGKLIPMTGVDDGPAPDAGWSPTGMDRDTRDAFQDYGFEYTLWTCPGWQNYEAQIQAGNGQLQTTYFYMGGATGWGGGGTVATWSGAREAVAPATLEDATSGVALASDAVLQSTPGSWEPRTDYNYLYWVEIPVHGRNDDGSPRGSNHIFGDGSGGWISGERLMPMHHFGLGRQCFWYQSNVGDLETDGLLIPD
ncbi:MAG: prepilin-type N-terminal cleavage/methylation domain-containing protein [Planctomycetota bacterium]